MARRLRHKIVDRARGILGDGDAAEDVAQETLLRLWNMGERLDDYSSVDALAFTIARNLSLDVVRRRRPGESLDTVVAVVADSSVSPDSDMIARDTAMTVDTVMAMLSPGQQSILRLRHVEGMEITEIAALIGSSENSVRVTLCRARQRVKELFMKHSQR